MAHRQGAAEHGPAGECDQKLLTNRQGLGVGRLRFLQPRGVEDQQVAQVVKSAGQDLRDSGRPVTSAARFFRMARASR